MSPLRRTSVASGEFIVSPSRRERLEAYLGTCVGLAVVDRRARFGGLLHILLPDYVSANWAAGQELCATTAVPRFLKELADAGCSTSSMEATVAGGALLGTVSRLDLDLDIGGRTVDIVNGLLADAGVPVVSSETGGLFGSKLVLDLETLNCTVEHTVTESTGKEAVPVRLTREDLARAAARIRPIPQAALKLIRLLQSEDAGMREIAQEVRRDQVLAARVLQACNSAAHPLRETIRSIDQALLLIGSRKVGILLLSTVVESFFEDFARGYSMSRGGLYHHAVSTAIVAGQIAMASQAVPWDLAYTAGLLHDIGKVLLDQYVAPARPLFYREVAVEGRELLDVERRFLGLSHEEAGGWLAERWGLPDGLRDAIAHHSRPAEATVDQTLAYLVYLADLLVSRFDAGHELDRIGADDVADALQRLHLQRESLPDLFGRIRWTDLLAPGSN